jgi:sec-independent protein translocase protein TatA
MLHEFPVLLGMFFAPMEWLVVGGVVLLLFGNRLPGMMRSLGRSVTEFKKGIADGTGEDEPEKIEEKVEDQPK